MQVSRVRVLVVLLSLVAALGSYGVHSAVAGIYLPGWNLVSGPDGSLLIGATGRLYTLQPGDTVGVRFGFHPMWPAPRAISR